MFKADGGIGPYIQHGLFPEQAMLYVGIVSRKINKLYQIRPNELLESHKLANLSSPRF